MCSWLWISPKDGDSITSQGNLCQCSLTLTGKNCFLMFGGSPLCFSLCPLPLLLSLSATGKSVALSSKYLPFRYLYLLISSSLSLLFTRLSSPSSFSLSSRERDWCFRAFVIFVVPLLDSAVHPCLSCNGQSRTGHNTSEVASPILRRGEGSPSLTCWHTL